jgi:hypothetical protein
VGFLIFLSTDNPTDTQCFQLSVVQHQAVISRFCQGPRTLERINGGYWLRCSDRSH